MKRLFVILSATVLISSCSKKSSDTNQPTGPGGNTNRVKTASSDNGTKTFTYTYDPQGRCVLIDVSSGKKTVFKYETGKVTVTYYKANGDALYSEYHELNEFGRSKRVTRNSEYDPDFEETRTFNEDKSTKQLIVKNDGDIQVSNYFYTNGNLDSIRSDLNGSWSNTMKYEYLDKANNFSNVEFGNDFTGKPGPKLIKSITYCSNSGNCGQPIVSTYEFDSKGRVVKLVEAQAGSPNVDEITYTYY